MFVDVHELLDHQFAPQVSWCGADTQVHLFLRAMLSATLACNYSLLWRCTASGRWRRIARVYMPSCFGLIPRRISIPMTLAARCCYWFGMTHFRPIFCHNATLFPHRSTLSGRDSQQLLWQSEAFAIRCTYLFVCFVLLALSIAFTCGSQCLSNFCVHHNIPILGLRLLEQSMGLPC